jgi:hypothetical protein
MRDLFAVLFVLISFSVNGQPQFDLQLNESHVNPNGNCVIEIRAIHSDGKPVLGLKAILKNSNIIQETNAQGVATIEINNPLPEDEIRVELKEYSTPAQSIKLKGFNYFFGIVVEDEPVKHRKHKLRKKRRHGI